MHDKHKDQLPLPQARCSMLKGQKKHIEREQDKTKHEAPRSVNYRATQNKNNIGTTALERSVHKKFGSQNGFLTQSMHLSENTKSNRSLWRNKERSTLG